MDELPYLVFPDSEKFTPNLTPRQAFDLGIFGGNYLFKKSRRANIPKIFFDDLPKEKYDNQFPRAEINYFGIFVPERFRHMPTDIKGHDGWFHWYIDYFYGVRNDREDRARIGQWLQELRTLSHYIRGQNDAWTNDERSPVFKQHLLHFAWRPNVDPLKYVQLI